MSLLTVAANLRPPYTTHRMRRNKKTFRCVKQNVSVHEEPVDVPTEVVDVAVLVLSIVVKLVLPVGDEVKGVVEDSSEVDKDEEVGD